MSLERIDSIDPTEVYDYIICGYVELQPSLRMDLFGHG
jgi:hypothetical protein